MDNFFIENKKFQEKFFNSIITKVQKNLPDITTNNDNPTTSALEGPQTKVELWESFKATNDKWISGNDFKTKTFFEDVLLMDRASRNIGDKVLVDIFNIINLLEDGATEKNNGANSYKNTLLDMVTTILVQNNFQHFMLPAYVNFYNVQDAQKNPTPRPDGKIGRAHV